MIIDIRIAINNLLDRVEEDGLPMPYSINLEKDGTIEVGWHEQQNPVGCRAIIQSYGSNNWVVHPVSRPDDPVLTHMEGDNEITLWCHPGVIETRVALR